jgi:hypothetical protein
MPELSRRPNRRNRAARAVTDAFERRTSATMDHAPAARETVGNQALQQAARSGNVRLGRILGNASAMSNQALQRLAARAGRALAPTDAGMLQRQAEEEEEPAQAMTLRQTREAEAEEEEA